MRKTNVLLLVICALMLFTASGCAEGSYAAGDMTVTAVMTSFEAGEQIHAHLAFNGRILTDPDQDPFANAAAALLGKAEIDLLAYKEDMNTHLYLVATIDQIEVLTLNVLLYSDGSFQAMTNLTGKNVLTIPQGTLSNRRLDIMNLLYGALTQEIGEDFDSLPARERLRISGQNTISLVFTTLMGWLSTNKFDDDDDDMSRMLYITDNEYIEETDRRDGIAQRTISYADGDAFCALMWDIASLIDSTGRKFQQAVADCLAEAGVTRTEARKFIDGLFTEEIIDPALDFVQPSHAIPDDGALCTYNDVSYFFKKLVKCIDKFWESSYEDQRLSLIFSYDDYGDLVGVDAIMLQFTPDLPYEGNFEYSRHTDENWQQHKIIHGELELFDGNRLIGDIDYLDGEDVDSINQSTLNVTAGLYNHENGSSNAVQTSNTWTFSTRMIDNLYIEDLDGTSSIYTEINGSKMPLAETSLSGEMETDTHTFTIGADMNTRILNRLAIDAHLDVEVQPMETVAFAGGQAMNLLSISEEQKAALINTMELKILEIGTKLITRPEIMKSLQTVMQ